MTISSILQSKGNKIITATGNASLQDITNVLAENKIGAVIIVDDEGKLCGIASERDIVRQLAKTGQACLSSQISTCMTHSVITCSQEDSIDLVMEKMSKGRFRHVPIMNGDELMGIISIGDVVKARIEEVERDAEDMKRYIAG